MSAPARLAGLLLWCCAAWPAPAAPGTAQKWPRESAGCSRGQPAMAAAQVHTTWAEASRLQHRTATSGKQAQQRRTGRHAPVRLPLPLGHSPAPAAGRAGCLQSRPGSTPARAAAPGRKHLWAGLVGSKRGRQRIGAVVEPANPRKQPAYIHSGPSTQGKSDCQRGHATLAAAWLLPSRGRRSVPEQWCTGTHCTSASPRCRCSACRAQWPGHGRGTGGWRHGWMVTPVVAGAFLRAMQREHGPMNVMLLVSA